MREFKKRRSRSEQLSRLGLKGAGVLVLFFFTVIMVHATWGMYGKFVSASQAQEEAQTQLASLKRQQSGVSTTLQELSTTRGQDAQLRERFGVAKPGEGEIDIVEDNTSNTNTASTTESLWQRVFHALFVW